MPETHSLTVIYSVKVNKDANAVNDYTCALTAWHISCTLLGSGEQAPSVCEPESAAAKLPTEGHRQCCQQ